MLQSAWGTSSTTWDFNGDGSVGGEDLAILLAYYSQSPGSDSDQSSDQDDADDNGDDPDIDPVDDESDDNRIRG